jgi:hypothetical protein
MSVVVIEMGPAKGGTIDVYLGSRDGKKIGTFDFSKSPRIPIQAGINMAMGQLKTGGLGAGEKLVLVFNNDQAGDADLFMFGGLTLSK